MRKIVYFLTMIFLALTSCEDVIDVELPTQDTQLVIEASINREKGTAGNIQEIKLSLTAPFFEAQVPPLAVAVFR